MKTCQAQLTSSIPPLKWVGGKRWLTQAFPDLLKIPANRYLEPFLGSGAVFFGRSDKDALLSDANEQLILCYKAIRDVPAEITRLLQHHQEAHCKDHYYRVRGQVSSDPVQAAAQFIYLNRTCWNGIYRVNRRGQFNVPMGDKKRVVYDAGQLEAVATRLKKVTLKCCDFEDSISTAESGDLIYCDPPYTVRHNKNGFVKYNESLYSWEDQERLRDVLLVADRRGVRFVLSNAAHPSLIELYSMFNIRILNRSSVVSGQARGRGRYEEILVSNITI